MVWHLQYSEYSGIAIVFCIAPSVLGQGSTFEQRNRMSKVYNISLPK